MNIKDKFSIVEIVSETSKPFAIGIFYTQADKELFISTLPSLGKDFTDIEHIIPEYNRLLKTRKICGDNICIDCFGGLVCVKTTTVFIFQEEKFEKVSYSCDFFGNLSKSYRDLLSKSFIGMIDSLKEEDWNTKVEIKEEKSETKQTNVEVSIDGFKDLLAYRFYKIL